MDNAAWPRIACGAPAAPRAQRFVQEIPGVSSTQPPGTDVVCVPASDISQYKGAQDAFFLRRKNHGAFRVKLELAT